MLNYFGSILSRLSVIRTNLITSKARGSLLKMSTARPTVGILIIGDEILKGKVQDTNSFFLCQNFYEIGIEVSQISIVPDDVSRVAKCVNEFSNRFTYVVTTGGVGPTHDDVTYEAVAEALTESLVENPELAVVLKDWCKEYGIDHEAAKKMGLVPQSSKIHLISDFSLGIKTFPIVSVKNIYIFPGIPSYLRRSFTALKDIFASNVAARCLIQRSLCLNVSEFVVTLALNQVALSFGGKVTFGSYPATSKPYDTLITIESSEKQDLIEAEAALREMLPTNCIVPSVNPNTVDSVNRVYDLSEGRVKVYSVFSELSTDLVKSSVNILEECFKRYAENEVCLSFNGGKDCTALLHLAYSVFKRTYGESSRFKAVYISSSNHFDELIDFIQQTVKRYDITLITYEGPLKEALATLKSDYPEIKAILIGTRRTDPRGSDLEPFKPTDNDWPTFMRVSPILDWGYQDIWSFLLTLEVSYCSLYDKGYTSIGNKNNTNPNKLLEYIDSKGVVRYRPAYLLQTSVEERNGRF